MYSPEYPQRRHVFNKFYNLVLEEKLACNIERGIFNHALSLYKTTKFNGDKVWNENFKNMYIDKAVSLYMNIDPASKIGNTTLLGKLTSGKTSVKELFRMNFMELFPEKYIDYKIEIDTVNDLKMQLDVPNTGFYKCGKCKSAKTTYYMMQTASGDESTAVFVSCHNCGKKWKTF
jgi:transcription elongation factor S-II